ncbi:MAG: hypothetical protein ACON3Z_18520 [Bradymonadia bacterium]
MRFINFLGTVVLLTLAGCGSGTRYQYSLSPAAVDKVAPPAQTLSAEHVPIAKQSKAKKAIYDKVVRALPIGYRKMLRRDQRLENAAELIAWSFSDNEEATSRALDDAILEHYGVYSASRVWSPSGWVSLGMDSQKQLSNSLRKQIAKLRIKFIKGPHRIGVAQISSGSRTGAIAAVITEDLLRLEAFKRAVEPSEKVRLKGKIEPHLSKPKLYGFSSPRDTFVEPLLVDESGTVRVNFTAPSEPGVYNYSVSANRVDRRTGEAEWLTHRLASFKLYVGVPVPSMPRATEPNWVTGFTAGGLKEKILDDLNRARVAGGREPLQLIADLDEAAGYVAEKKRKNKDPIEKEYLDKLPDIYRDGPRVFRSFYFASIDDLVQRRLKYPGSYRAIMNKAYDSVSIKVVRDKRDDDVRGYWVVAILTALPVSKE